MEESLSFSLLGLVAVGLLVLANAFFVAAEFSLVSVRKTRIAELAARGEAGANAVQKAINNPDRVIAATQLGITLTSLSLGWIGEPALGNLLYPVVSLFPANIQANVAHTISAVLAFTLITFLHVVAGELAPKSIALQNPERTSLFVASPILWIERLFKPAIWALNGAGNILLHLMGVQPASGHELVHSVEELKMLVSESAESGVVKAEEGEMLQAVFGFRNLVVRQVMVPRTEVVAVEADTPLTRIVELATETTFTKFPVYEESLDQVLGVVHIKDILLAVQSPDCEQCTARQYMREPLFAPETLGVSDVLRLFRVNRQHIAIVLDEFGGTAGLATLEDLLEEIVGEVNDPFDENPPGFQTLPDGSVLIDGLTLIDDVNEQLGLELSESYYDTIGGYVMGRLGRIPRLNDTVEIEGVRLRVAEMDGMRVARVTLTPAPAAPATGQDGASQGGSSPAGA
jgi:CBS domain containing-hemolysin-like protein